MLGSQNDTIIPQRSSLAPGPFSPDIPRRGPGWAVLVRPCHGVLSIVFFLMGRSRKFIWNIWKYMGNIRNSWTLIGRSRKSTWNMWEIYELLGNWYRFQLDLTREANHQKFQLEDWCLNLCWADFPKKSWRIDQKMRLFFVASNGGISQKNKLG